METATRNGQRLAATEQVASCPSREEEPPLGHSFDTEHMVDQDNEFLRFLNCGTSRRLSILNMILTRCVKQGDCLIWSGPHSGSGRGGGYGRISFEGTTASVHRLVYSIVYGPIPPKKQVDHECNNRLCCNPMHLKHTTHKRNQKLRDERSKQAKVGSK